ncbi:hypothetical protein KSP39_PZI020758 [Platanthera zijinensis]|uniref:Integrase catalytic domain-containing protein n=1 Tax=Platanthera zijinensis TaxID=2320716 RepID=A0AAP0B0C4_9ASPA
MVSEQSRSLGWKMKKGHEEAAHRAFEALQAALVSAPILRLPDFREPFYIKCDASALGCGAVLQQRGHPLAYFSRRTALHHRKLPAYELELIGLAKVVQHWRPYLWGRSFVVRTDHYSLKYLLEQRLTTVLQQRWVSKLLEFDFIVEYKAGALNRSAYALSRRHPDDTAVICTISRPIAPLWNAIRGDIEQSPSLTELLKRAQDGLLPPVWTAHNNIILYLGRVYLPPTSPHIPSIFADIHNRAHEGVHETLHRIHAEFYWKGLRRHVQYFIAQCAKCHQQKSSHLLPAGLLQPLPVPTQIWADISMDFVEGLPRSLGKYVLMVVVDRFSKGAHFISLACPLIAERGTQIFFVDVFRLHGLPESIVADRGMAFTNRFWKELFTLNGTKLAILSTYPPPPPPAQSNGQTEIVSHTMEMYHRCLAGEYPKEWLKWLPWIEYCYNTSYHSALQTKPFRLIYGRYPPKMLTYGHDLAKLASVDQELLDRNRLLATARDHLLRAQHHMETAYNRGHRDVSFAVGEWVWLKCRPYRQATLCPTDSSTKLGPRFYGPFQVARRIGEVAYQLHASTCHRRHASMTYRLSFGCNDKLQLGALISTFTNARCAIVAAAN